MAYNGLKTQPPHSGNFIISPNKAVFSLFAYFINFFFIYASDQLKELSFAHLFVASRFFFISCDASTQILLLLLKRKTNVWHLVLRLNFKKAHLKKCRLAPQEVIFFLVTAKRYAKKSFLSWSESHLENNSHKYEKSKKQAFEILTSLKK